MYNPNKIPIKCLVAIKLIPLNLLSLPNYYYTRYDNMSKNRFRTVSDMWEWTVQGRQDRQSESVGPSDQITRNGPRGTTVLWTILWVCNYNWCFWWIIVTAWSLHYKHPSGIISLVIHTRLNQMTINTTQLYETATELGINKSQDIVVYFHSTQPAQWSECNWYQQCKMFHCITV